MRVERLIEELKKFNPKAEVRLNSMMGDTVLFVNALANNDNYIWLDGENDIDLGAELDERFRVAVEKQLDELDFYTELLDIGITVDMVKKYIGVDEAHHMQVFCEEHCL